MKFDQPNPLNEPDYSFNAEDGRRELEGLENERARIERRINKIGSLLRHAVDEINIEWHNDGRISELKRKLRYGPFPGRSILDEQIELSRKTLVDSIAKDVFAILPPGMGVIVTE